VESVATLMFMARKALPLQPLQARLSGQNTGKATGAGRRAKERALARSTGPRPAGDRAVFMGDFQASNVMKSNSGERFDCRTGL